MAVVGHAFLLLLLLLLLVLLVLSSSAAADASFLCVWTKVLAEQEGGEVHYSFLRRESGSGSASVRLYHSSWSRQRALLGCTWSDDASVIQNYASLCLERPLDFSSNDGPDDAGFDLESVFGGSEDRCVSVDPVRSMQRSEVRGHQRVKRGFIVPGTLWCGSGNKALSYSDLGVFSDTDSCCREHDQCKHTILSFHSEFGVFNSNIFTMSHCDCDNRFRSCLKEANDSISDVVGYTFFNLLKMHCFQFSHRLQCTQRNWFGMCKETKMALYAVVHPPTLYVSTNTMEAVNCTTNSTTFNSTTATINSTTFNSTTATINSTSTTINSTTFNSTTFNSTTTTATSTINSTSSSTDINSTSPAEPLQTSTANPKLFPTTVASTVPALFTSSPSTSVTTVTKSAASITEKSLPNKNQTEHLDADVSDLQPSCDVYKDLDQCSNKILPQQSKYGLRNQEPRTLYHCNCTNRLFQTLVKQRRVSEVQVLLLRHVSQSCFLPPDCTVGQTCTAAVVLVRAELPQLVQRVEGWRHLQAVNLQVRREKRRMKLQKLCVRMRRRKLMNKTRKHKSEGRRQ